MSGIMNSVQSVFGSLGKQFFNILDRIFPPEKRTEAISKLQNFAVTNPKLAAFLTAQIALSGIPLLLFLTFSLTVFLFSLIAALLIGLVAALLFTVFMLGVALVVVLPTVFMTTFAATFIFLWGLGGYYILKWFNEGDALASEGSAIGDKLNSFTGGRLGWLTDGARKKQDDAHTGVDKTPKIYGSENDDGPAKPNGTNGTAKKPPKLESSKDTATKPTESTKNEAPKPAEGVKKRVANSSGGAGGAADNVKAATK